MSVLPKHCNEDDTESRMKARRLTPIRQSSLKNRSSSSDRESV